mmetsp:Transcript_57478/g.140928  ORF Transcript_57478/g.140928 Transcript_57478/m.140928 type:complete len:207 (+) Transcript_57478:164-784(+)
MPQQQLSCLLSDGLALLDPLGELEGFREELHLGRKNRTEHHPQRRVLGAHREGFLEEREALVLVVEVACDACLHEEHVREEGVLALDEQEGRKAAHLLEQRLGEFLVRALAFALVLHLLHHPFRLGEGRGVRASCIAQGTGALEAPVLLHLCFLGCRLVIQPPAESAVIVDRDLRTRGDGAERRDEHEVPQKESGCTWRARVIVEG